MFKRFCTLFLSLVLLGCPCMAAYAHPVPDLNTNCSVTFNVCYDGKPITGGTLTMYRVGDIVEDDGNYYFQLTEQIDPNRPLEEDMSPERAEEIKALAQAAHVQEITVAINNGEAVFTNVTPGLYVVAQQSAASGYAKMGSFLISLPYFDGETYQSDVVIDAKVPVEVAPPEPPTPDSPDPSDKAPQTGQLNWPIPVLAAGGLALFIIGWALRFGRRKDTDEE